MPHEKYTMTNAGTVSWLILAALLAAVIAFWPGIGLLTQLDRRRNRLLRESFEDVLKHIFTWEGRGQSATPESLAGALGMAPGRVFQLVTRLERKGLVQSAAGSLRLTPEGERWALHVVRAHRLWERYLSDETGMPMSRLHSAAEKAEHHLTAENLDVLEAHLGHPQKDPHGDPIPSADGSVAPPSGVPLTDWPLGKPARVAHLEDEPDVIFKQILAAGLRPGMTLRILESDPERLVISDGENEHRLANVVAANIHVVDPPRGVRRATDAIRLSELRDGEAAEIVELDQQCRGFSRRRLLDLGMTPGARVEVALDNTFGDPRAFRIRGTMIALRQSQTDQIWVRRASGAPKREAAGALSA